MSINEGEASVKRHYRLPNGRYTTNPDEYAKAFGFSFQIADDLEDEAQDSAQQGKNILGLHEDRESARALALERMDSCKIASRYTNTALLRQKLLSLK